MQSPDRHVPHWRQTKSSPKALPSMPNLCHCSCRCFLQSAHTPRVPHPSQSHREGWNVSHQTNHQISAVALAVAFFSNQPHPRVPHPSQSHREGWDASHQTNHQISAIALAVGFFPISHQPGCPILRSLIAKGGMQAIKPTTKSLPLLLPLLSSISPHPRVPHPSQSHREGWDVSRQPTTTSDTKTYSPTPPPPQPPPPPAKAAPATHRSSTA
jgi:hypothetical protein